VLHEANETTVELLVSLYFVLELTLLVSIELLFIHRKGQSIHKAFKVFIETHYLILQVDVDHATLEDRWSHAVFGYLD
jgi:hypothetical protein